MLVSNINNMKKYKETEIKSVMLKTSIVCILLVVVTYVYIDHMKMLNNITEYYIMNEYNFGGKTKEILLNIKNGEANLVFVVNEIDEITCVYIDSLNGKYATDIRGPVPIVSENIKSMTYSQNLKNSDEFFSWGVIYSSEVESVTYEGKLVNMLNFDVYDEVNKQYVSILLYYMFGDGIQYNEKDIEFELSN